MVTEPETDDSSLPLYLKVIILVAILVVLFILGIDLLVFADAL